jgi:hypothetical protein
MSLDGIRGSEVCYGRVYFTFTCNRYGEDMKRAHLPLLGLAATILASVGFTAHLAGTAADPVPIAGGQFEASGVVHVPSSSTVLFVDDGRTREVFALDVNADGSQRGTARAVSLQADVTDLEGITTDGKLFYVVGSQSKKAGADGDGLVRFAFDAASGKAERVERIQGLKNWLTQHVAELQGSAGRKGENALNIEGLAWDPAQQRLLLGLRAPVVDGQALIIPIRFKNPAGAFSIENLVIDEAKAIRIPLDGAGIRSIEYDAKASAFRIIAEAGRQNRDFRIVEWRAGETSVREVARFASRLKPEGVTPLILDGQSRTLVVFDTGRVTTID